MSVNMEGLTQNEKIIWNCWELKSHREIVREAAAKGTHIALALKYLMNKNNWDETTAQECFNTEVTEWTIQLLLRKQIFKVLHVLNKVKFNPEQHLMTLAENSDQIEYRDFIVEQLEKMQKDMKPESIPMWEDFKRHWNLLRFLEKSFEVDGTFKQNKVFGIGKDRIVVTETEIKALTIKKIKEYSEVWKKKIATSLFFSSFEFSLLDFCTPEEMWNHLLDNNKAMILVRWVNIQLSEVVRDMNARYNFFNNERFSKKILSTDSQGYPEHILDSLDEIFRKWHITKDMISAIAQHDCYTYTKMCIYDTLSSYGIVNDDDRKNLYQIVRRLARTQNLNLIDDIFSESCATMTKQQFYVELAKYCVKHKLYKMLTICVECNILDTDLSDVEKDAKEVIELWLLFKSIEQTSDRQSHVVPVYKTCEQIAKDNIGKYISANPQLVLGMILLEDNAKLFDIFSKEDHLQFSDFRLPNEGYRDKLPHLYNIYQKFYEPKKMYEYKDVNVYQLLSSYKGLDISKVFEFQLLNHNNASNLYGEKPDRRSLGSLLSSEADVNAASIKSLLQKPVDMPDFANEKLMKRYGYVAKLTHIYYLKQYRPCNASQAFVAQQYQNYNRLQDKNIKSACCEAHALALQNWDDPAMIACAISFVAMIGCNPARCRVHMSAVNMIKNYFLHDKKYPEDKTNKIIQDYSTKLIQSNENAAKEILRYLEEITMFKLKDKEEQNGKVDMALVLYESQTMVKFAMLHQLPLPEMQLREFIKSNSWFNFLLFGDVFRYPLVQMLQLSQEFENKSYAEHLKHIMLHRSTDDGSEKSSSSSGQRRVSRMNSMEVSPSHSGVFEFPTLSHAGGELWEVAAACHGPEDPPAALLRAAQEHKEPLLVLIASCYEPNAIDMLWPQWILASLGPIASPFEVQQLEGLKPDQQFQKVAELCLSAGYVATLHESMLIFMPESPLTLLTSFLYRTLRLLNFENETSKLLSSFLPHCQRKYSMDTKAQPWQLSKEALQKVAVALVKISICQGFDSAYHQREFLKCIASTEFDKGFSVPTPNFVALYEILQISMETSLVVSISRMLQEDAEKYLLECVETYTVNRNFDVALKIAKLAGLPVNNILVAEWTQKHEALSTKTSSEEENPVEDKDLVFFIAQCSEAFKKAAVTFKESTDFLSGFASGISDPKEKFYAYRIIMSWFEEHSEYGKTREDVEHAMWEAYFQAESTQKDIFLNSCKNTLRFVLSEQKDATLSSNVDEKPFSSLLSEIEIQSDVGSIERVVLLEPEAVDGWRKVISRLLELRLLVDAFRLSALFSPASVNKLSACPVQVVRTCLKLAEGLASPYDMPQELRLIIASPLLQSKSSLSEISDASFEELVEIQDRSEAAESVPVSHLAAREDADRLAALDALAHRTALPLVKQVASYFRIALQIGWQYPAVLKYQGHPVNFVNFVSGRARMTLANLVFKTFNVPSKQVADYLSHEMVSATISPHLLKTSTFRQKEHFQYTLWGYALNSDIELFLNMRPDACRHIGRQVLDYLMAFQKIYKVTTPTAPKNQLDDSNLDVETLVDEEYSNVDGEESESIFSEGTLMSADTDSNYSVSTMFTVSNKLTRETRRNLFDIIASSSVHIRYEIKSNIRKITKGAKLSSKQVNIICIELLVIAHACFRWGCDVEGVAVCVRSAQALAARLLAARSYRLMVRLLTNTKLYTEGAYILHALRDNHQFEFLLGQFDYMLGQQPESIAEFKQGLLDFLRNHCPGDTDTFIMVALHFNMYSEAADMKKKQAMNLIEDLEKMAVDASKQSKKVPQWLQIHDNVPTRSRLETALNHLTDAAELYLQAGCGGRAGEAAALAQHVALQVSLLNASPTRLILNRSTEQVYKLVSEYLSFMEGLVLLSGRGEAWRELAYRRALSNDQAYLRDMAAYRPDVAYHFINRFKTEKNKSPAAQAAMTELRNLCR